MPEFLVASDDEELVAFGRGRCVVVRKAADGSLVSVVQIPSSERWMVQLVFSHEKSLAVKYVREGVIVGLDGTVLRRVSTPHGNAAWSPSGKMLVAIDQVGDTLALVVVDAATGTRRTLAQMGNGSRIVDWADGERLFASSDAEGQVTVWELSTGAQVGRCGKACINHEITLSPDGQTLIAIKANPHGDHAKVIRLRDERLLAVIPRDPRWQPPPPQPPPRFFGLVSSFSPDGRLLLFQENQLVFLQAISPGDPHARIRVLDTRTWTTVARFQSNSLCAGRTWTTGLEESVVVWGRDRLFTYDCSADEGLILDPGKLTVVARLHYTVTPPALFLDRARLLVARATNYTVSAYSVDDGSRRWTVGHFDTAKILEELPGCRDDARCGGLACPRCAPGKPCATHDDCASGVCEGKTCK